MIKLKKFFLISLSFVLLISGLATETLSFASNLLSEDDNYYVQYIGSTKSNGYNVNCTFTVDEIVNNRFRGRLSVDGIDKYSFSNAPIEGPVTKGRNSFTCRFTVRFYNDRYYSIMSITVYPYNGTANCICVGSWHMEDFDMVGTKFEFPNQDGVIDNDRFNKEDMQMCMKLSEIAYDKQFEDGFQDLSETKYSNLFDKNNLSTKSIIMYNYKKNNKIDSNKNNAAFFITYRINEDNSCDMIVVIRGTYHDEWNGNAQITGSAYDSSLDTHYNFNKGKESVKAEIVEYYNKYLSDFDTVNLIITGHSRGAAVSNLYAKEATDKLNGAENNTIPDFDSVTAYTFACPNVAKYNSSMETSYDNILNFCFKEDLVPTVPLTSPTLGWNYWKYGQTYFLDLSTVDLSLIDGGLTSDSRYVTSIHKSLGLWPSVDLYYNKPIIAIGNVVKTTTLYDIANNWTNVMSAEKYKQYIGVARGIGDLGAYAELAPLIACAVANINNIKCAHDFTTYNSIISVSADNGFYRYTYYDYLNSMATPIALEDDVDPNTYNQSETQKLIDFYNTDSNNTILDWNIEDPGSWSGITFNENGNVEKIELPYKGLTGALNLSDFSCLTVVDISFNSINSISLSNCIALNYLDISSNKITTLDISSSSALVSLNCSCNDLSECGLNISANNSLISLICDYCGLSNININALVSLEELSCSFNKLTSLDLSDCANLTSVTCCYNYLDTHEGGDLYNTFDDLMFNDCYVNYYPQSVPENATFNTTELNALKTFANTNNNESVLDWLDDNGNIDTNKLQNNVLFEYDGSKYRIVAIDIADLDVSGDLNVTSLSLLKELYCENTKITTLNIKNCTVLETLKCDGCCLTTLTLPSNAADKNTPLYDVSCEYNYLDTSIFTESIVKYVEFKAGGKIEFESQKGDSSALQAALFFANRLDSKDYSEETFSVLKELIDECNCYNYDNLYLTQDDIDKITTDMLTAMYDLKAYFNISVTAENGALAMSYNDVSVNGNFKKSILYGTTVTLNVTPDVGYSFVGWYDEVNNRYLSNDSQFSFKVDSNLKLKAVTVPEGSTTLTFANYSNWVAGTVTKTTAEWAELSSISDLLPEVPYRYGYSNGRWVYDEQEILLKLQSGENALITAEYDEDDASLPTPRAATDTPLLDLYYKYDNNNHVGSYVMAAGFPQDIQVESVGIAFYYKNADCFDPTENFILLMNNKMLVSRFNTDVLEDIYIVNMKKMTSTYNWAVRGYVTYYDENDNLVTVYSNQINIIDTKNADEINLLLDESGQYVNDTPKANIEFVDGGCD